MERNEREKYKKEQIGQSRFSIPQYNLLLLFCIPKMKFLSDTVMMIPLTQTVEKEKWINIGKNKQEKAGS